MREEVVDDGIEVLGREYLGCRIGISVEIVEVSGGGLLVMLAARHWIGRGLMIILKMLRGRVLQWG